jgi:hypothetical protein
LRVATLRVINLRYYFINYPVFFVFWSMDNRYKELVNERLKEAQEQNSPFTSSDSLFFQNSSTDHKVQNGTLFNPLCQDRCRLQLPPLGFQLDATSILTQGAPDIIKKS